MANGIGVSVSQRVRKGKTVWVVRWRELLEEAVAEEVMTVVVSTSFDAIGVAWLKRKEARPRLRRP